MGSLKKYSENTIHWIRCGIWIVAKNVLTKNALSQSLEKQVTRSIKSQCFSQTSTWANQWWSWQIFFQVGTMAISTGTTLTAVMAYLLLIHSNTFPHHPLPSSKLHWDITTLQTSEAIKYLIHNNDRTLYSKLMNGVIACSTFLAISISHPTASLSVLRGLLYKNVDMQPIK